MTCSSAKPNAMPPMPKDIDFEPNPTEAEYAKVDGWVEDAELIETGQFGDDDSEDE
jgi:hypothetical protein